MSSHKPRIVIDGNIGSGKTTQLKLFAKQGISVQCEPIQEWPLEKFYSDKSRWAFLLQMSILESFVKNDADVWERSPESSKEVFWKMLRNKGIGTDEEDSVYSFFYKQNAWRPDIHVYVRTSPEVCFKRISDRCQKGDAKISLEYLKEVHKYYEEYICNCKSSVIVIDGNQTPEKIQDDIRNAAMFWDDTERFEV